MALENGGSEMIMPVQPINYGYNNNGGWGMPYAVPVMGGYGNNNGFGGDWGSLLILFLFAAMFGGFGGGFGGFGGFGDGMFPWLMAGQAGINSNTNAGFDNAAVGSQLNAIQNSITTGFSNGEVAACNRAIDSLQTAYGNQIASMNQSFANQMNLMDNLNSINNSLNNCCCENRAAVADLKYTVATEACADRAAVSNALTEVLTANTASTQKILDQMCQDKIDAKNERIADLERQLTMANFAASQTAQTAAIRAGQVAEIDAMYDRLRDCPVPTMPVYGSQPIFTCPNNNNGGCGCGYNG